MSKSTPTVFHGLDALNAATRYIVVVRYPTGEERYLSEGGALTSDLKLARKYKRESSAKAEARTVSGVARMVLP